MLSYFFDGLGDVICRVVADEEYDKCEEGGEDEACSEEGFRDDDGACAQKQIYSGKGSTVDWFAEEFLQPLHLVIENLYNAILRGNKFEISDWASLG